MKRKISMLIVVAMMLVGSALPALAQPADPECSWYFEGLYYLTTGEEWYGFWCHYGEEYGEDAGWEIYAWWNEEEGYYFL